MSLKGADLPDYVLATLYNNCLVEEPQVSASAPGKTVITEANQTQLKTAEVVAQQTGTTDATSPAPYKFLGKNSKRISIIAGYEADPYMPEEHLEFLTKILSACKLNLGDVAILNYHAAGIEMDKLGSELKPLQVLLFGVDPISIGLPLSFPMFKLQMFNGTNFLLIPPIVELNQDTDAAKTQKKQLWECLKKLFLS